MTRACSLRVRNRTERYAGNEQLDCDRTVIRQAQNLEEHRGLRAHSAWQLEKAKSLIACALPPFEVRQCGWRASFSKRARSTTPTSLRFRISKLRLVHNSVAQNTPSNRKAQRSRFESSVYEQDRIGCSNNCDKASNIVGSLSGIWSRRCESNAPTRGLHRWFARTDRHEHAEREVDTPSIEPLHRLWHSAN